jgi:hypothetical protein
MAARLKQCEYSPLSAAYEHKWKIKKFFPLAVFRPKALVQKRPGMTDGENSRICAP